MLSDAFVAAWLPGTEAVGITDLLFTDGKYDFTGRLPYSWPARKCDNSINSIPSHLAHLPSPEFEQTAQNGHSPLFPLGYGLSLNTEQSDRYGIDTNSIELDARDYGCGIDQPDQTVATEPLELFSHTASDDFALFIGGTATDWQGIPVSRGSVTEIEGVTTTPIDRRHQQDAVRVEFTGESPGQVYLGVSDGEPIDLKRYFNSGGALEFEIAIDSIPTVPIKIAMHCIWPCIGEVDLYRYVSGNVQLGDWMTISIPLADFEEAGMDFAITSTPFLVNTDQPLKIRLGMVRFIP